MTPGFEPETVGEAIAHLGEESAELAAACLKTLRFGLTSVNPLLPEEEQETNRTMVKRELDDVLLAAVRLSTILDRAVAFTQRLDELEDDDGGW